MQTLCHIMPLVNTIYSISKKYENHYCYPSQKTLQSLLKKKYGIKRSIATINRWLRIVEDLGYIKRVRRIRGNPAGGYSFKSTMYFLRIKGLKKLNQLSYNVFEALEKYYSQFKSRNRNKKNTLDLNQQSQDAAGKVSKKHEAVRGKPLTSGLVGLNLKTL